MKEARITFGLTLLFQIFGFLCITTISQGWIMVGFVCGAVAGTSAIFLVSYIIFGMIRFVITGE